MNEPTAIIMGYGIPPNIFTDDNYQRYLRAALNKVIVPKKITRLILCGGHTNIHYPEKTEAGEMLSLLQYLLPELMSQLTCDLIEDSITGWENLESATALINELPAKKVYVLCEKTRTAKVWLTARFTLPVNTDVEIVGIYFDTTRNPAKDLKQYFGFLVVAAEHFLPDLRRAARQRQIKHIQRVSQK